MTEAPGAGAGRIVVGVDGSPSSGQALRWGARAAAAFGAGLDAVRADLTSVVQTALEPAQVWVWVRERQAPPKAARTAARIASSSPSSGSLPSMRSPST